MAFTEYLKINGELLPLPDSYDLALSAVESDSGGETEAGTIQRDVVRQGVVDISVSFTAGCSRYIRFFYGNGFVAEKADILVKAKQADSSIF